jgi:predicted  nucleic acid-binding Zn-ribbon protein
LRCGNVYKDNDNSVLKGCSCGSVFFMFLKSDEDVKKMKEIQKELELKETTLEKELERKIQEKRREKRKFAVETIRTPKEGVYEIDLDALMKKRPLIILEKGKSYFIHLSSVFERFKR